MIRGDVLRLFLRCGGRVVDGRTQKLEITEQNLMNFLSEFEGIRAGEVLDIVADARRKRTKDALNSEVLDKRRGTDVKTLG